MIIMHSSSLNLTVIMPKVFVPRIASAYYASAYIQVHLNKITFYYESNL